MKVIGIAAALALPALVLAGLEDAKYSTVLGSDNFNKVINSQSVGTLVAFFAPWCGHCKSLEGTWTKVAQAFQDDDRCKVAHFDADNANNRPLAEKYGVQGFPTIKFIPTGGGKAVDYQGARSEEAFLEFLNEKCGTHRLPGSALSDMAGRIPSLDNLASSYLSPTAERPKILSQASSIASSLTDSSSENAAYYIKIMTKYLSSSVEEMEAWIKKESERLSKMLSRKGAIAGKKLDELRAKQNILAAFKYVEAQVENVVDHIKGEL
ncbi:hypothetical protein MVLG_02455 [Microbotryum lychnidis-dioicae p1A1 Lamole]|uniref:protein disulfide-isomerase n=1 Tax=Microbotryum lychnidis-dioicae (strain p1A1 Lamole / MvSl-1064) TaxID=683840 RepID=U5H578_USTV1|nr:hypothetical protein MVLG_02455 [Microbotryum lychnidis-dioicae p1A1 Lamole]|eukprot:KDE07233.1 hypothetical protein MVLG_02455 [Microbotryum lychnidis-dioicae p1A1 Lamole]